MPHSGGVYTPPGPPVFPVVFDTIIDEGDFNTLITDIATALTLAVTRDGQSPMTAALPMGGQVIANLGNGTLGAPAVRIGTGAGLGLYSPGANLLALVANGAAVLTANGSGLVAPLSFGTSGTQWTIDSSNRLRNPGNTQPSFKASLGANDQTSGSTVIFGSEYYDYGNNYDPVTGVFTAPVPGQYLVGFSCTLGNTSGSQGGRQLSIAVDGSDVFQVWNNSMQNNTTVSIGGTLPIDLTVNNTVRIDVFPPLAANFVVKGVAPSSFFWARLLG